MLLISLRNWLRLSLPSLWATLKTFKYDGNRPFLNRRFWRLWMARAKRRLIASPGDPPWWWMGRDECQRLLFSFLIITKELPTASGRSNISTHSKNFLTSAIIVTLWNSCYNYAHVIETLLRSTQHQSPEIHGARNISGWKSFERTNKKDYEWYVDIAIYCDDYRPNSR